MASLLKIDDLRVEFTLPGGVQIHGSAASERQSRAPLTRSFQPAGASTRY